MRQKLLKGLIIVAFICSIAGVKNVHAEDVYTMITGGESLKDATSIALGTTYATSLGADDEMYFKFTTDSREGYYYLYCKNVSVEGVTVEVLNSIMEEKMNISLRPWEYGEDITNTKLEPSTTYYIKANTYGSVSGNIKFSVSFVADKFGDTKQTSKKINIGKTIVSSLDGCDDIDCFRIVTKEGGEYELSAKNININLGDYMNPYTRFELCNNIDEIIGEIVLCGGCSEAKVINLLPNTTYYIKVWNQYNYTGNYKFSLSKINHISSISLGAAKKTLPVGKHFTLKASILPANSVNKELIWESGNDSVASVSDTGIVTANKPGRAVITATSKENENVKARRTIIVTPKKTNVTGAKNVSKRKLKVVWEEQWNVSGYQIQYSTSKNFKGAKTKKVSSRYSSYTIRSLKKKIYYVRIRAYSKIGSKVYYGAWSTPKKVRIKK